MTKGLWHIFLPTHYGDLHFAPYNYNCIKMTEHVEYEKVIHNTGSKSNKELRTLWRKWSRKAQEALYKAEQTGKKYLFALASLL